MNVSILSITGTDNTGGTGIQADIKTITALGGEALTAVTTVTVQDGNGIQNILDLPQDVVIGQVKAIINNCRPKAIKVGMVRDAATIRALRREIIGCRRIVVALGVLSSKGERILSDDAFYAFRENLIPEATVLMLRCKEAEMLLNMQIHTDDDMIEAASRLVAIGAKAVLLRGGHQTKDRVTALLYTEDKKQFFTSQNTEGWQKHGVGGAFSTAIATRLAMGDDIYRAIHYAHDYMHSQVVYSVHCENNSLRPVDLYNKFMSLLADHYREAHDVAYYADKMAITTRYLSLVTNKIIGKSPKEIISDYLLHEAHNLLLSSRFTISEISYKLGFSSQAMFSKFFYNREGCSPLSYRNNVG